MIIIIIQYACVRHKIWVVRILNVSGREKKKKKKRIENTSNVFDFVFY